MSAPFTFTPTAPATNMSPASSQPLMQQNFASTNGLLGVDHVTFNNMTGGEHTQVTLTAPIANPTVTGDTSRTTPQAGSANTFPQLFFSSNNGTVPLSMVKAFGVFSNQVSPSLTNSYNVLSITGSPPTFTITLNANTTTTDNVAVLQIKAIMD